MCNDKRMTPAKMLRLTAALVCILGCVRGSRAQNPLQPAAPVFSGVSESGVIEAIEIRGARRIPQDILRTMLSSKPGDMTNETTLRHDFTSLWQTGRFDDIKLETVRSGSGGIIIRFTVTERALARAAQNNAGTPNSTEAILDRFERR
jgi:outer membrane protein insertion porin family